jgi:hypothetical protein
MITHNLDLICNRNGKMLQIAVRPQSTDTKRYREPVFSSWLNLGSVAVARDIEHVINEAAGRVK